MIVPPGLIGVAFGDAADGDGRTDDGARQSISARLGVPADWAVMRQVHGVTVAKAVAPGALGIADGAFTTKPGLPIAVATADCVPVALVGPGVAALAHAGWRGLSAGVIGELRRRLEAVGLRPQAAAIGPAIGPCCYEVGPDVMAELGEFGSSTREGRPSIDLWAAAAAQSHGLEIWRADHCTMCGGGYHSHRRTRTSQRQVALAWLPMV